MTKYVETMPITGFPDYEVSNTGRVWSHHGRGRWLRPAPTRGGYLCVSLHRDGEGNTLSIHRLVAVEWVQNPHNYPHVNHMDGDKTNNHYTNLEWVTHQQKIDHACDTGLYDKLNAPVDCFSAKTGKKLQTYKSITVAARCIGGTCNAGTISGVISGKYLTAGGYQWRYSSDKISRLPPLTAAQISHSLHTCANYHVRNVTTGEEFFSHEELRSAGYSPSCVRFVLSGSVRTHAKCNWERM